MRMCEVKLEHESVCRKMKDEMQKIESKYKRNLIITIYEKEYIYCCQIDVLCMLYS